MSRYDCLAGHCSSEIRLRGLLSHIGRAGKSATVLLVLVMLSSCSSVFGRGNDGAPAKLVTRYGGADKLATIDRQPVSGDSYNLWPGRHRIEVTTSVAHCPDCFHWGKLLPPIIVLPLVLAAAAIRDDTSGDDEAFALYSPVLSKCFVARPGHTYEVRTSYQLGTWRFEIFDHATTYDVAVDCR